MVMSTPSTKIMKETEQPQPTIFDELNQLLKEEGTEGIKTIQSIAEAVGVDRTTLNNWIRNDEQFATELQRFKEHQEKLDRDFPELRFTVEEDGISEAYVTGKFIELILMQTKERKGVL